MKHVSSSVETGMFRWYVILLSVMLPHSLTMSNPEEAPLGPESYEFFLNGVPPPPKYKSMPLQLTEMSDKIQRALDGINAVTR